MLACHAFAEVSCLLLHFFWASGDNYLKIETLEKRKREVRLYVQAKYNDFTTKRETEKILDAERK